MRHLLEYLGICLRQELFKLNNASFMSVLGVYGVPKCSVGTDYHNEFFAGTFIGTNLVV